MDKISKCTIPELSEKFMKVNYLLKEQARTDPTNEPYRSKYEGRELLIEMSNLINDFLSKEPENDHLKDILAVVYCLTSIVCYDVEELSSGNDYVNKALKLIPFPIHPSRIICAITCLNNLGFWECCSENYKTAQEILEKAESFYYQYNNEASEPATDFELLFTGDPNNITENGFEKCHTQTLFYLAQVYSKNENTVKSAKYCHTTLKRQLESGEEDAIEWALNAATLSQFLIEQNAFKEARHHLAASQKTLEKYDAELTELLSKDSDSEDLKAKKERVRHRLADVFRCWVKYSIFLLNKSKERLICSEGDRVDPVPEPPEDLKGLKFTSLVEEVQQLEKLVTADFILMYEDAVPLFQKSQDWLNRAKEFYSLEDHASEYATVIQDSSKLYHLLSFFQADEATQCKLHKRRIDMLSAVVNSLNPKYYLKTCQEIWFEIGETCMTMADIKASKAKEGKDNSHDKNHSIQKVKQLTLQGIKYLEEFVQSFKLKSTDEKYPEEFQKNIVLSYMYLGHLYAKVNETDKGVLIDLQEESLRCYKTILDYCLAHPEAKQLYAEEYAICQEMVQLIPLKIGRLKSLLK